MVTERTLRIWRKEALKVKSYQDTDEPIRKLYHFSNRILRMTQELLDIHLMKRK